MRIQTILNRVEKFKSFVHGEAALEQLKDGPALIVQMKPRKNGRAFCSGCGRPGPVYDRLEERRFEFVPLWGILVFLAYRMRRVNCKRCGVTVEMVPWCDGKNQLTTTYRWFLATWAKRLSWSEVGSIFRTSWDSVCRSVEYAVAWGLAHRDLSADGACLPASRGIPAALGVQECLVGRDVPGRVDEPRDAFAPGADEEDCPEHPHSSTTDLELVSGARSGLIGRRGRAQQQGETGDEKVVRFSNGESRETGSFTQPRRPSRAETLPQILLRRQI